MKRRGLSVFAVCVVLLSICGEAFSQSCIGPLVNGSREDVWVVGSQCYSSGLLSLNQGMTLGKTGSSRYRDLFQWAIPDSILPDGVHVTQVRLEFTARPQSGSPQLNFNMSKVNYDITGSTSAATLFSEGDSATNFLGQGLAVGDTFNQTFSEGPFTQAIEESRGNNRFTLLLSSIHEVSWDYYYNVENWTAKLTIWVAPVQIAIDQKRSSGVRLSGTMIGHWNGTSFTDLPITSTPDTINVDFGSREVLKGCQETVTNPTEKYHVWKINQTEQLDTVQNHRGFSVTSTLANLTSTFGPTNNNIVIKNDLIDAQGTGSGRVQFRDPWYIDFADASYNRSLRNRGMTDAIFYSRLSPFVPDDTTQYDSGRAYKGVFLNQPIISGQPYYSVGAPDSNVIGGFATSFVKWGGSNVTFQYPISKQSGVVFSAAGATAIAMYKAHLGSSIPGAVSSNSQRKLVSNDGSVFFTSYESVGDVWLTRSLDAGSTWGSEILISDGTGISSAPSLVADAIPTLDPQDHAYLHIIYRTQQSPSSPYDLYVRNRTSTSWPAATKINTPSTTVASSVNPHPVIGRHNTTGKSAGDTPELLAVWEGGLALADHLKYSTSINNGSDWQPWAVVADVPSTNSSHRNPSLTSVIDERPGHPLYLTYDNNDNILMQTFGGSVPGWHDLTTVPASISPTSLGPQVSADTRNSTPSVYVVWEAYGGEQLPPPGTDRGNTWAGNGVVQRHRVMYQKWNGSAWTDAYEFRSGTLDYRRPTVSNLDNGHVAWSWDDGSNMYQSVFNGTAWSTPSVTSGTTQPNLAFSGSQYPLTATRTVSTSTNGPIYRLNVSSPISRPESGPQASVVSQQYSRRIVVARRPSLRGGQSIEGNGPLTTDSTSYLSLELAPLTLPGFSVCSGKGSGLLSAGQDWNAREP